MAANKTFPEIRVIASTTGLIPNRGRTGLCSTHILGDYMGTGRGDGSGLSAQPGLLNATWGQNDKRFAKLSPVSFIGPNMEFIRFYQDGSMSEGANPKLPDIVEVGGLTLRGEMHITQAMVDGVTACLSSANPLQWSTVAGTWKSVATSDGGAAITNTGKLLATEIAMSITNLSANQGARCDFRFSHRETTDQTALVTLEWGNGLYRVALPHGDAPRVDKNINGTWVILRRLTKAPLVNLRGGDISVRWMRRGARLTVNVGGYMTHILETVAGAPGGLSPGDPMPVASSWPAGKLTISATACRACAQVYLIDYFETSSVDSRQSEWFILNEPADHGITIPADTNGVAGHLPESDSVVHEVTNPTDQINQKVTLKATVDGMDAPMVTQVHAMFAPPTRPTPSGTTLDITSAVMSASLTDAMPPMTAGPELNLTIDRTVLSAQTGGSDFDHWGKFLDTFCPITFESCWHYDDGTTGPWIKYFSGYVYTHNWGTSEPNDGTMTITAQGPICRLQAPASVITHRWPPLDTHLLKKVQTARAGGAQSQPDTVLYGADCVQEILRMALGDDESQRLNGAAAITDPWFKQLKYFPYKAHYPLMRGGDPGFLTTQELIGGPPAMRGLFFFPQPFGDDALTWIKKIADMDRAVFYYGWAGGYTSDWPMPIYGRMVGANGIQTGRPLHTIYDAAVVGETVDQFAVKVAALVQEISAETRPDKMMNTFVVWGSGTLYGDATEGMGLPSFRIAETSLSDYGAADPNRAELTWERTQVVRNDFASMEGGAEAMAAVMRNESQNTKLRWPSVTFRGQDLKDVFIPGPSGGTVSESPVTVGDRMQLNFVGESTDASINLAAQIFRVERVENSWEMDAVATHVTKVGLRPLLADGN